MQNHSLLHKKVTKINAYDSEKMNKKINKNVKGIIK